VFSLQRLVMVVLHSDVLVPVLAANLPHDKLVKIYELYFLTLRAGHAGQAYDITGQEYLMDDVVCYGSRCLRMMASPCCVLPDLQIKTGNNDALLRAVVCTHRLKSAVPAGNLARTGMSIVRVGPGDLWLTSTPSGSQALSWVVARLSKLKRWVATSSLSASLSRSSMMF